MARFTLDSSMALAWCLKDEQSPETSAILDSVDQHSTLFVSAIWPLEVANILGVALKQGRISEDDIAAYAQFFSALPLSIEPSERNTVFNAVFALSRKHGLTTYDASYLEISLRRSIPIATLDKALISAAKAEGVDVLK